MGARHPETLCVQRDGCGSVDKRSRPALGETLPPSLGTSLSPSSWSPTYHNLLTGDYLSYSPHPEPTFPGRGSGTVAVAVRNHVGRGRPAPEPVWGFEIDEQMPTWGFPSKLPIE